MIRLSMHVDMLDKKQIANIKAKLASEEAGFPLVFQALGDPCRFKIFKVLMRYHDICVTDIANICDITLSAASQQLRTLERLGLVQKMRMGQTVCYEINVENPITKQLFKLLFAKGGPSPGVKGPKK